LDGQKLKDHKQGIAEYFSKKTEVWKSIYSERQENTKNIVSLFMIKRRAAVLHLVDTVSMGHMLNILDCGSGPGSVAEELLKRGHHVICIDLSAEMIKEANKTLTGNNNTGFSCFQADIEGLCFKESSFDMVICVGVLQYLQRDANAVGEIGRVLKPQGTAIVSLPNMLRINTLLDPYYYLVRGSKYLWNRFLKPSNEVQPDDFGSNDSFINRRYVYAQLRSLFKYNNLREEMVLPVGFGPVTFWREELFSQRISVGMSNFFDRLFLRKNFRWLVVLANRWVVCLRKRMG
jgi:SAM-dependent methyltransferase